MPVNPLRTADEYHYITTPYTTILRPFLNICNSLVRNLIRVHLHDFNGFFFFFYR